MIITAHSLFLGAKNKRRLISIANIILSEKKNYANPFAVTQQRIQFHEMRER